MNSVKSFKYKSWSLVDDDVRVICFWSIYIHYVLGLSNKQRLGQEVENLCSIQKGEEKLHSGILNRTSDE